jgi:hypothetical protein
VLGRVLVTHDLDFGAIPAASGERSPSVIQLRTADLAPDRYAPLLIAALEHSRDALSDGAFVTVSPAESACASFRYAIADARRGFNRQSCSGDRITRAVPTTSPV